MAEHSINRVLIIGGGISGLVAATLLQQSGVTATIVEQQPEWTQKGSGIHLYSNALRALDRIGVAHQIVASGSAHDFYEYADPDDVHQVRVRYPRLAGDVLPALATITRQDLHEILLRAATDCGVEIRLDSTIEQLEQQDDHVVTTTGNGQRESFDLVVAADGIYSSLRDRYLGKNQPVYSGQVILRALLQRHEQSIDPKIMFAGAGMMFGIVPVNAGQVYMIAGMAEPERMRRASATLHTLLHDRFHPVFGGIAPYYLDQITDAGQVTYTAIEMIDQPAPWHKGRLVFIGDAVHASPPYLAQGAAMAIEDAIVLGDLIAAGLGHDEVARQYMARRLPRAEFIRKTSLERNRQRYQGGSYQSIDGEMSDRMRHLQRTAQPLIDDLYDFLAQPI